LEELSLLKSRSVVVFLFPRDLFGVERIEVERVGLERIEVERVGLERAEVERVEVERVDDFEKDDRPVLREKLFFLC
tara:strand:+ start:4639 stop:4869 length:231 start_codon:yes stop_codon:yes gene_type:complete